MFNWLFVYLIGVLSHTKDYSTYTTAITIIMGLKQAEPTETNDNQQVAVRFNWENLLRKCRSICKREYASICFRLWIFINMQVVKFVCWLCWQVLYIKKNYSCGSLTERPFQEFKNLWNFHLTNTPGTYRWFSRHNFTCFTTLILMITQYQLTSLVQENFPANLTAGGGFGFCRKQQSQKLKATDVQVLVTFTFWLQY